MDQYRIDAGGGKVEVYLDANGFLRAKGTVAKVGVYTYRNQDGTTRAELVTAECLADAAANDSLSGSPLTLGHPIEGMVNVHTSKIYTKGSVNGAPKFDAATGELQVDTVVTHADAIEAIDKRRVRQLSPGYKVDLEMTPGIFEGTRYDCVQTKRYYNHLALVSDARGGKDCRLNLDRFDHAIAVDNDHFNTDDNEDNKMATITLPSGVTVEVGDASTAATIQAALRKDASDMEQLKKDMEDYKAKYDEYKGKYDSAVEEAEKAKSDNKEEETEKRVDSLLSLIETSRKIKPDVEFRADGKLKTDREIMCDVLGKKFDGESDIYVKARFDAAIELATKEIVTEKVRNQRTFNADGVVVMSATETHRAKFLRGEA